MTITADMKPDLAVSPDRLSEVKPMPVNRRLKDTAWRRRLAPMLLLVAWGVGSGTGLIPSRVLPGLGKVLATAWTLASNGTLESNLAVSLERVVLGLALGVAAGSALALVAGLSRLGDDLIDPNMQMLRTLPALALVPLFIVWFGIGEAPKIYMIALATAFPIYLNLYSGIKAVDPKLLEGGRTLGLSRLGIIRHVILPSASAPFLVGLRFAAGVAWLVLVVCEQINANTGIGAMMSNAEDFYRTDIIVVGLLVYAILGLGTDALVRLVERRALAWRS